MAFATGQRAFVSYSRSDLARASGLAMLLEALGHRVFLDHQTISPGAEWKAELQTGRSETVAADTEALRRLHSTNSERLFEPVIGSIIVSELRGEACRAPGAKTLPCWHIWPGIRLEYLVDLSSTSCACTTSSSSFTATSRAVTPSTERSVISTTRL